jgi:catechol 2,3-dioxygenase-like lactoylglutathione lyase family enzyme
MFASAKMVGFIPTTDYDKARAFYEGKLGFKFVSLDQFALVMTVGGHMIRISKMPNFKPLQGTILGWQVEDVESAATWLHDRGPRRQQSRVVQGSRRQHPWRQPACVLRFLRGMQRGKS